MGYDVHITRAENWVENEGHKIEESEWHALIESDPELRLAGYNGPHFTLWDGHPEEEKPWLDWRNGNIFTKYPDEHLLAKMLDIADRLHAKVQGDDGEVYTEPTLAAHEPEASVFSNGPLLSFVLSLFALASLVALILLDAFVRKDHPVGTPRPMPWPVVFAALALVAVPGWLVGGIFAIVSLIARQPRPHLAWLALAVNAICAVVVGFLK